MQVRRILVPIDFSRGSLDALDYAIDLNRSLDAKLTVVFAHNPLQYAAMPGFLASSVGLGMVAFEEQEWAREELAKLSKRLAKRGVECRTLVATGQPYERIVDIASNIKADLIVMATHGRTGLPHLVLGSVAERVVRMAPCAVLIVRGRAKRRRPSRPAARKIRAEAASSAGGG